MKLLVRRTLPWFAVYFAAAAMAQAHPGHAGHEGGGLAWDFSHLAANPVATLGCGCVLALAVWGGWSLLRHLGESRAQSLRGSHDKPGN